MIGVRVRAAEILRLLLTLHGPRERFHPTVDEVGQTPAGHQLTGRVQGLTVKAFDHGIGEKTVPDRGVLEGELVPRSAGVRDDRISRSQAETARNRCIDESDASALGRFHSLLNVRPRYNA